MLGERKRWVVVGAFLGQALLVVAVALLQSFPKTRFDRFGPAERQHTGEYLLRRDVFTFGRQGYTPTWVDLLPIGLLSFQSAGGFVASRVFKFTFLQTTAVTALPADVLLEAHTLRRGILGNGDLNRRVLGFVAFVGGAALGGGLFSWSVGAVLWVAAAGKLVLVGVLFLWRAE